MVVSCPSSRKEPPQKKQKTKHTHKKNTQYSLLSSLFLSISHQHPILFDQKYFTFYFKYCTFDKLEKPEAPNSFLNLERSYYMEKHTVSKVESNMIEKMWFKGNI